MKPGDCSPLERRCDEAWKHWLLNGNITRVRDPPECCRPWHAFDMFTIEYAEGYRGILKVRKHSEMTSDVVGYHVERLLGLNMTVPVFSWALSEERYRALVGGLRDAGVTADDGRRRRERWEAMGQLQTWFGYVAAEVQPFYTTPFIRVDGSVCAKMPGEALHPRNVFKCAANGSLPAASQQLLGHGGERRSRAEMESTCKVPAADVVDALLFDFLTNMVDRKGNCFLDPATGRILLFDNDSGSWDPQRTYPHGSGCCYPNLKRVRLRDILAAPDRVNPVDCKFSRRTVLLLQRLMAFHPDGMGGLLRESLHADHAFAYMDAAFERLQPYDPYQVTNDRVRQYLGFFEDCSQHYLDQELFLHPPN
ncbi:MAG: hypothetical protein Q8P67_16025 [archaeon]|nr:hypothetical protein [archaeon]